MKWEERRQDCELSVTEEILIAINQSNIQE